MYNNQNSTSAQPGSRVCEQCQVVMNAREVSSGQCAWCQHQQGGPLEWDTNDAEAMPNLIRR
ncbi:MAG: hypothetical protein EOP50_00475 [Sphingobacteriales bacterium]|nr:MAG: hypothetical protein EOP50_00475 [Sphingobacteriales bacterium]